MFGIDVRKYASSLVLRQSSHFPEDIDRFPLDAAEDFICPLFPSADKVLKGYLKFANNSATREMIAQDIATDPVLRSFLRRVYSTDAVITVTPTLKGKLEIKQGHKYYVILFSLIVAFQVYDEQSRPRIQRWTIFANASS
jgi:transcription elongation factor SPT6